MRPLRGFGPPCSYLGGLGVLFMGSKKSLLSESRSPSTLQGIRENGGQGIGSSYSFSLTPARFLLCNMWPARVFISYTYNIRAMDNYRTSLGNWGSSLRLRPPAAADPILALFYQGSIGFLYFQSSLILLTVLYASCTAFNKRLFNGPKDRDGFHRHLSKPHAWSYFNILRSWSLNFFFFPLKLTFQLHTVTKLALRKNCHQGKSYRTILLCVTR